MKHYFICFFLLFSLLATDVYSRSITVNSPTLSRTLKKAKDIKNEVSDSIQGVIEEPPTPPKSITVTVKGSPKHLNEPISLTFTAQDSAHCMEILDVSTSDSLSNPNDTLHNTLSLATDTTIINSTNSDTTLSQPLLDSTLALSTLSKDSTNDSTIAVTQSTPSLTPVQPTDSLVMTDSTNNFLKIGDSLSHQDSLASALRDSIPNTQLQIQSHLPQDSIALIATCQKILGIEPIPLISDSLAQYLFSSAFTTDPKSPAHAARVHSMLYPIEYEYHGHKAEVRSGATILGVTGFKMMNGHTLSYTHYPLKLAGIWARSDFNYDPSTLNLNNENGLLTPDPVITLSDTPVVKVNWLRGPASSSHFDIEFQRQVTDSIIFQLYGRSNATDSSASWNYANQTHQFYLATMQRDSVSIPFSGRNLKIDNQLFSPALTFFLPNLQFKAYANLLYESSDDAPSIMPEIDTLTSNRYLPSSYSAYHYSTKTRETRLGTALQTNQFSSRIYSEFSYTDLIHSYELPDVLNSTYILPESNNIKRYPSDTLEYYRDSLGYDDFQQNTSTEQTFYSISGSIEPHHHYLPSLHYEGEYRLVDNYIPQPSIRLNVPDKLSQYSELTYLEHTLDLFQRITQRIQAGYSRSVSQGSTHYAPALTYDLTVVNTPIEPFATFHGFYQRYDKVPDVSQKYFYNSARLKYPNAKLIAEEIQVASSRVDLTAFDIKLSGGLRGEFVRNYIGSSVWDADNLDTTITTSIKYDENFLIVKDTVYDDSGVVVLNSDSSAQVVTAYDSLFTETAHDSLVFSQKNYKYAETVIAHIGAGFALGNWTFYLERQWQLSNSLSGANLKTTINNLYRRNYKGSIIWSDVLVNDKLGIQIKWEWEWFGGRHTWARSKTTQAEKEFLGHYLVNDFETRLKISDFQIYIRIDNMNHSIYNTDVGYSPWGVTFKYGVQWNFKG
ncbi:MAG: hypothetical protein OCC49_15510 [Fibrobacterales bacterium]